VLGIKQDWQYFGTIAKYEGQKKMDIMITAKKMCSSLDDGT